MADSTRRSGLVALALVLACAGLACQADQQVFFDRPVDDARTDDAVFVVESSIENLDTLQESTVYVGAVVALGREMLRAEIDGNRVDGDRVIDELMTDRDEFESVAQYLDSYRVGVASGEQQEAEWLALSIAVGVAVSDDLAADLEASLGDDPTAEQVDEWLSTSIYGPVVLDGVDVFVGNQDGR